MIPWRASKLTDYRSFASLAEFGLGRPRVRSVAKSTRQLVTAIRQTWETHRVLSESAFRERANACRERARNADPLRADFAVESFALTAEAMRRELGMEFYDVQLIAGLVLSAGVVAEIQTGEGKTITAALPAVLHAWSGNGVHVATTNAYLSTRDFELLRPVYLTLGLTTASLDSEQSADEKADAYAADITYGPGYEFGFDFLRDQVTIRNQMKSERLGDRYLKQLRGCSDVDTRRLQRGLGFTVIDEVDSVLIDEASTPLVLGIASENHSLAATYELANRVAKELVEGRDFLIRHGSAQVVLTHAGQRLALGALRGDRLQSLVRSWVQFVEQALVAHHLLRRDGHYVVQQQAIALVDQTTGRIHRERRWSGGLHQSVEAKEGLSISPEQVTEARVTRQRFLSHYDSFAGLTGTASDAAEEFFDSYRVPVVSIETHRPCRRQWLPLRCFGDEDSKLEAICQETIQRQRSGQPVLIGTTTIDESRRLSILLGDAGVTHEVLNGLQDEDEATLIAKAGRQGHVTVATNMAGRGTDIRLTQESRARGGLHVIGSSVQISRRVDRQLAGRAARQGEPGSVQFFCSADEALIQTHHPELASAMETNVSESGECLRDVSRGVYQAQRRAEE
ncbi:MAG: preprotein translocase subunit SecA, partial [Planctomycetota bacterium]